MLCFASLLNAARAILRDPDVERRLRLLERDSHSPRPLGNKLREVDERLDVLEAEMSEHTGKNLQRSEPLPIKE